MILNALNDLYSRLVEDSNYEVAKPGYSPQNISFRVVLKSDGSLFSIQDARISDEKGKLRADKQLVIGEAKPSGAGINPGLLWDNTSYMLGYKKPDKDEAKATKEAARAVESFAAFREGHLALEAEINHPHFSAVCRFLENWSPEKASDYFLSHPELDELTTGFGIFAIQGEIKSVNSQPEIMRWWESRNTVADVILGQCLITGDENV
jgi:CRISPR-associated protein Csd1